MTPHHSEPTPERLWSRSFPVDRFGPQPYSLAISATEAERAAIAAAFGCRAIEALEAKLELRRRGERLFVEGEVRAKVTQTCVVTLEPVGNEIIEDISLVFAPPPETARRKGEAEEETLSLDAEEPPEPIIHGQVDLGAAALEFFSLGLDPYPRKPGVEFTGGEGEDRSDHPFARLAKLKRDA